MHQGRVLALLEPFLEHSMPAVRQVASLYLMKATYRELLRISAAALARRIADPPPPPLLLVPLS